jgi:hypothetical protein
VEAVPELAFQVELFESQHFGAAAHDFGFPINARLPYDAILVGFAQCKI